MIREQTAQVAAKLRSALDEGVFSAEDHVRAQTLLPRLDQPARIAAIGQRGSGKTTLLNALIGEDIMPDVSGPPTVELVLGNTAEFVFHDANESSEAKAGQVAQKHLVRGCSHVVQKLPLAQLQNKSFVEIQLPASAAEQAQVLEWMASNIDIVIWCSQDFDDIEHSIWQMAPDAMKDHAFLALTCADRLMAEGRLQLVTDRFQEKYADEFMGLYPIASEHALSSRQNGAVSDSNLWRASGGEALAMAIDRDVDTSKQADSDFADVLMSKCLAELAQRPAQDKTLVQDKDQSSRTPLPPAPSSETISPMKRGEAIATALTVLQAPVDEMLRNLESNPPEPASVLEHTSQAAQALATLFMDANTEDHDISVFRENVLECEQVVLLLQHEGTEAAAYDAATALLQLKKEMSEVAFA